MARNTITNDNTTTTTARVPYMTGVVTSRDGTTIAYRQLGRGPGIVLLHGSMESAQSHMQLAEALADDFTLYLPNRRGRGGSGPFGQGYSIQTEVEDLSALLMKTGAHNVFGVSSAGLIALQAALTLPDAIHKVAVYEPALIVNHSLSTAFVARYDREMAEGKIADALVTGMLGAQMGPPMLNAMPRWLLRRFTTMGMAQEEKQAQSSDVTMRQLAPTLHYDFEIVTQMAGTADRFRAVRVPVLLLGGSRSPRYLKTSLDTLEKTLPNVQRVEFPGLDHGGSSDASATNRGSQPGLVAQAMRRFFA